MTDPFITVIVAPLMVAYNKHTGDAGLLYNDIWDTTVLEAFQSALDLFVPHCPCWEPRKVSCGIVNYNLDYWTYSMILSLFSFQKGNLLVNRFRLAWTPISGRFTYLEVCNIPFSMCWPMHIGLDAFLASIQVALGTAASTIFKCATEGLDPWFEAIKTKPARFIVPSCPFHQVYDSSVMTMDTGTTPITVLNRQGSHLYRRSLRWILPYS
jgi:hypothetical protein